MTRLLALLIGVTLASGARSDERPRYDSSYDYELRNGFPPPMPDNRRSTCPLDGPGAWSCDRRDRHRPRPRPFER